MVKCYMGMATIEDRTGLKTEGAGGEMGGSLDRKMLMKKTL